MAMKQRTILDRDNYVLLGAAEKTAPIRPAWLWAVDRKYYVPKIGGVVKLVEPSLKASPA